MTGEVIVVVGAGHAGGRAALHLREAGHSGPLTLVGAEAEAPYERPPLSKGMLEGEAAVADGTIATAAILAERSIDFRPGCTVCAIDRATRRVFLASGERLAYDKLLLATGREPRRLPLPGGVAACSSTLRDITDARALKARLRPGFRLAILGGGFIGLEVAASARAAGAEVTLIELAPRLLVRGVPASLARALAERHAAAGVALRLGRKVAAFTEAGPRLALILDDGEILAADHLLVGIGAEPRDTLARAAGLAVDRGIVVDATLRTSDPRIWAAGDVTAFPHPRSEGRLRLESWDNAERQAALVARNMLGAAEAYRPVPWFWSDQYELTLQLSGFAELGPVTVERMSEHGRLLFFLAADGVVAAVASLGTARHARAFKVAQKLVELGRRVPPATLADPTAALKPFLR